MKKVVVRLQGGIGNQLFQFFAGYSVAIKHGSRLVLDKSLLNHNQTQHSGQLEDLKITVGGEPVNYSVTRFTKPRLLIYLERVVYKLLSPVPSIRAILRQFRSKVIGYDCELANIQPSIEIIGYFQTYKYLSDITEAKGEIEIHLSHPSRWYEETKDRINRSGCSVALHMRRGDYSLNKSTIGMLADDYFIDVVTCIGREFPIDTLYIFSDSIDSAEILKSKLPSFNCEIVIPPNHVSSVESLLLIKESQFKIISNSTFSWWGAFFANTPSQVFAPTPWYRNHQEPGSLVPEDWKRFEAIWHK